MTDNPKSFAFGFSGIEPLVEDFTVQFFHHFARFFKPIFLEASEFAQFDFIKFIVEPNENPIDPINNQIFTFAYSLGVDRTLKEHGCFPEMVAGFSLGIYAALCSAGAVTLSDGLKMVQTAYELMERESRSAEFGMSAIVGLSDSDTAELIDLNQLNSIQKVNTLNDTCRIYSGTSEELAMMNRAAIEKGAITAASLGVNIPYHHPEYLKNASIDFRDFLKTLQWKNSEIPVISSIDQHALTDKEALLEFTVLNLSTPIHWQRVVEKFSELGCNHIVECGPGITLTQNGRFLETPIKYFNTRNIKKRLAF
jgi:[acyl-carrier-protein] S-malonyltransferase